MQSVCLISILILFLQVRDVLAETTMAEDVVLQRIHVMKVKETAMDLEMEARMMDTKDVNQDWFVDQIIARSLASTTMRRMTAVRGQTVMVMYNQTMISMEDLTNMGGQ